MEAAAQPGRPAPRLPHGPIRVCFTCDEEIGHGVDHVDLKKLGAVVGYTLDGGGAGEIDGETFSADLAVVTDHAASTSTRRSPRAGWSTPSAWPGCSWTACRGRSCRRRRPTDREGFLHPYRIEGGVAEVTLRILLRDFDTPQLAEQAELLRAVARTDRGRSIRRRAIDVQVTPQYRNMADGLAKEPRAVAFAEEAMRRAGLEPKLTIVRGGTDGSRLTELGLPTPNLSTRRTQHPLAAGVDLPGGDGDGGARAGRAGEGVGERAG